MESKLEFEELYKAYNLCLKNKKKKRGTYKFTNDDLCKNLIELMDKLNTHTYSPKPSNCYVVTDPALREIYAAQFSDRIVQHFYMKEIENILEEELIEGCCSCRKGKGTDYALKSLRYFLTKTSNYGKKNCYYLKIDLSGYFMSIDRKQVSDKFNSDKQELLSKVNSQIGTLKRYNARKLILQYKTILPQKAQEDLVFDKNDYKFLIKKFINK